jgi:hypothetical protein
MIVDSLSSQLEAISTSASHLAKATKPVREQPIEIVSLPSSGKERTEPKTTELVTANMVREPKAAQAETPVPQDSQPAPASESAMVQDTEEKLADYYGVNQVSDAVMFVTLYPRAHSVQIAGDFNGWQPEASCMERVGEHGTWRARMDLPKGRYRYRLVVDGQWQQDPYNENMEMNPYGDYNSVLEVH